jgi:[ribosomal protein S5]-alanine N-acetyltransferase
VVRPRDDHHQTSSLATSTAADAQRAFEIQSDWAVTRMLRMASFPPDRTEIEAWFADHPRERTAGEAYRFAVTLDGRMIGLVDIDEIADGEGELGYWFEQAAWGQGFASEAASAVVRFAFTDVGLLSLRSGHAADNAASAGFWPGWVSAWSTGSSDPRDRAARSCCNAITASRATISQSAIARLTKRTPRPYERTRADLSLSLRARNKCS